MALFELSERLQKLPPYLFAEIDRKKKAAIAAGRDIINLGIGDPDRPTPQFIIDALAEGANDPATHQYALDNGDPELRRTISEFFARRYAVELDPDTQVYPTIGSKEAINHFPLAYLNEGDAALVPEPGYPPYRSGVIFAGADPVLMPLLAGNDFFPDLGAIAEADAARAKAIYVNYPNSPSGKLATKEFFADVLEYAEAHDLIVVQDAAYAEMSYGGRALSILEMPGAMERSIEFHSLSKTFNMTGWRVGWACGSADLVAGLGRIKTNLDSGIFTAVQRAATAALEGYDSFVPGLVEMYQGRRDAFCDKLNELGLKVDPPEATFYCWIACPEGYSSTDAASRILEEADVVVTPGLGFGPSGEGFIRATLTVNAERLVEAAERMAGLDW